MTTISYESDIVAWSKEQARLVSSRQFELLDLEHIAEEIEAVGKSEQRELANRMALLLAHLLKWKYQPERQGRSRELTIRNQRRAIQVYLKQVPSLKARLEDAGWWEITWGDALYLASQETGLEDLPEACPWMRDDIPTEGWLPDSGLDSNG